MPSKTTTAIPNHADRRIMVFIDGSNLYHVLEQNCSRHDVQFDKFAMKLANGRDLKRIYYYNIRQESDRHDGRPEQERFLNSLYDTPYVEVRLGIAKQRGEHMVEKGVDVMLATDLVVRAYQDQYDTAIIVSGDGDFYPAIQAVKDSGKQVEVAAFETNISPEAARVADLHLKLTKTFFTGLWMTRARARRISQDARKPEVGDQASSPNGEDKAPRSTRSRSAASRQRSASTPAPEEKTPTPRTPRIAAANQRTAAASARTDARKTDAPTGERPRRYKTSPTAQPAKPPAESKPTESGLTAIRRTPARRRVGGTASPSSNGSSETATPAEEQPGETAATPKATRDGDGRATAARKWRLLRRVGLMSQRK